ncbi:Os09g0572350 [Oryza sativa Japonica Group]|uniref:Os09g0572350 protein n=1 Tax=Oryza sativa subsp. japonica TaxID=39947 RepID=C7J6Q6_ORYSJ|nr:Os09g0572350 [Oryza sativa Japonica Group]|eukprot:NP_001175999.1 Os09g0572350 [Oryza sativa Japonica Group]
MAVPKYIISVRDPKKRTVHLLQMEEQQERQVYIVTTKLATRRI